MSSSDDWLIDLSDPSQRVEAVGSAENADSEPQEFQWAEDSGSLTPHEDFLALPRLFCIGKPASILIGKNPKLSILVDSDRLCEVSEVFRRLRDKPFHKFPEGTWEEAKGGIFILLPENFEVEVVCAVMKFLHRKAESFPDRRFVAHMVRFTHEYSMSHILRPITDLLTFPNFEPSEWVTADLFYEIFILVEMDYDFEFRELVGYLVDRISVTSRDHVFIEDLWLHPDDSVPYSEACFDLILDIREVVLKAIFRECQTLAQRLLNPTHSSEERHWAMRARVNDECTICQAVQLTDLMRISQREGHAALFHPRDPLETETTSLHY